MNKKDAADYLGISTRALEYHVKQGNIGVSYERGKTGDVAVFDEAGLRALKARITRPARPATPTVMEGAQTPETESRSLMRLSDTAPLQLLERLADAITSREGKSAPVPVADKLTLSLAEASALSGLSRNHLREAIGEKKLKARIIGRGWRVKRIDLNAYVKRL
jgi:excisionase family DNA binding protein